MASSLTVNKANSTINHRASLSHTAASTLNKD